MRYTRRRKQQTRRKRLGKAAFIKVLNDDFQEMMQARGEPGKHLFFQSIRWWKRMYDIWSNQSWTLKTKELAYNPSVDLSQIKPLQDCRYMPKKILTKTYLHDFYQQMTTTTDYAKIRNTCHDMTNYALPSPSSNITKWKQFDDPDAMNVMILGTGPVGLYTALYLHHLYNKDIENMTEFSFRKVNILLVDNRIFKEGVKMPYSRSTQFGFSIEEIQPFLQHIFCWNMEKYDIRAFDYIHVLENLLYTAAYQKNISMAFTKRFDDPAAIKEFVTKENIHVLFDCTGGRSRIPMAAPPQVRWSSSGMKEGKNEIRLNPVTSYYEYAENGKTFTTQVLRLQFFDARQQEILVGNEFAEPTDPADIALAKQYNGTCFHPDDFLLLASRFQKDKIRNLFLHMLDVAKLKKKDIAAVKVVVFDTIARHSPFAAAPFQKDCVMVRVGDSLAGTEYGIVFGMKHSIEFSKHICQLLSTFF